MPSLHHYKSKLRKDFFGDDAGLIGVYVIIHLRFILTDMSYDRILNRLMTPHFVVVVVEAAGFFFVGMLWALVKQWFVVVLKSNVFTKWSRPIHCHCIVSRYSVCLFYLFIHSHGSHGEKWDNFRAQVQHVMLQPSTARKYILPLNDIANDFMDR